MKLKDRKRKYLWYMGCGRELDSLYSMNEGQSFSMRKGIDSPEKRFPEESNITKLMVDTREIVEQ